MKGDGTVASIRSLGQRGPSIPWELLRRLGEGRLSEEEVQILAPLLLRETQPVPNWMIARAATLPRQERMERRSPGLPSRIIACLVFDSALQPEGAGVRTVCSSSRRLIYYARRLEVDLEVSDGEDGLVTLSGQIADADEARQYGLELRRRGAAGLSLATNELGYFVQRDLEPSTYSLVIRDEHQEIEVGPLAL